MTTPAPRDLAPVFDDHDANVAWTLHITRANGGRPYVIAVTCSGHFDKSGKWRKPRVGRATLEADWFTDGLREEGDHAIIADADWTAAPEYRGPLSSRPENRLDVARLLLESTVEASAVRPRRERAAGQSLRVRVAFVCKDKRCRDSVPFGDKHELERILDELASHGVHTVDLNGLRAYMRVLHADNPSTVPPTCVE